REGGRTGGGIHRGKKAGGTAPRPATASKVANAISIRRPLADLHRKWETSTLLAAAKEQMDAGYFSVTEPPAPLIVGRPHWSRRRYRGPARQPWSWRCCRGPCRKGRPRLPIAYRC